MTNLFFVIAAISALFVILLVIKSLAKLTLCVICLSVSVTWLAMLVMYKLGYFENPALLALLMGQSITGIYYLFEKKVSEEYHVFRLPLILTLTFLFYAILLPSPEILQAFYLLISIWLIFILLFVYRKSPSLRGTVKKVIECCKDW